MIDRIRCASRPLDRWLALLGRRRDGPTACGADHAARDPSTGLLNRRAFGNRVARMIGDQRIDGCGVAMLAIGLDRSGPTRGRHDCSAGEATSRAIAAAIGQGLPDRALATRIDADRFACAFPIDSARPDLAGRTADAVLARITAFLDIGDDHASVAVAIGMARTDAACGTSGTLMRRADIALEVAQREGDDRRDWSDAAMAGELERREAIERGLRAGIPAGQITPWFEPQVALGSGEITGFELHPRWDHPDHGIVAPDIFLPVAGEADLIGELWMSAMRAGIEEARCWDSGLRLAVKPDLARLRDPGFARKIVRLLAELDFPAGRLEVGIDETALYENEAITTATIAALHDHGVKVALGDLGSGYSDVARLRALPLDRIRIDQGLVRHLARDADAAALVRMILSLADSLDVPVLAAGVDHADSRAMLVALGCAAGQGRHFGGAATARATRGLLAGRGLLTAHGTARTPAGQFHRGPA